MALIYETENFILESHEKPEISREEGGHITITPKEDFEDHTKLPIELAQELMRFTIVAGKAFKVGMAKQGIDIGRINYQENGNWKPHLHVHLYGRAIAAIEQKYGEPLIPGHKEDYLPLNEDDIEIIRKEIELIKSE